MREWLLFLSFALEQATPLLLVAQVAVFALGMWRLLPAVGRAVFVLAILLWLSFFARTVEVMTITPWPALFLGDAKIVRLFCWSAAKFLLAWLVGRGLGRYSIALGEELRQWASKVQPS